MRRRPAIAVVTAVTDERILRLDAPSSGHPTQAFYIEIVGAHLREIAAMPALSLRTTWSTFNHLSPDNRVRSLRRSSFVRAPTEEDPSGISWEMRPHRRQF